MSRQILLTLLFVLVLVIGYVVYKTPVVQGLFAEHFSSDVVVVTACPDSYTSYMYEGSAYCCRGKVNTDSATLKGSCVPPITNMEGALCTLGASKAEAPNCSKLLGRLLAEKSAALCPPSKPNFCSANKCCASTTTANGSDCSDPTAPSCKVGDPTKVFAAGNNDCTYQRMKEHDTCPPTFSKTDTQYTAGPLSGLTVYGCFDNISKTCFSRSVVSALQSRGLDASNLPVC